jgi:hypothetical protein
MNNRISQAYGYAVCFITVIVMLIGIKQVVDAAFDLSDPIRANGGGYGTMGRTITSFELYKADAKRQPDTRGTPNSPDGPAVRGAQPASAGTSRAAADTLSDAELRHLYDAERETVTGNVRFRATRSLVGNLLLIVLAATMFGLHWRWLKRHDAVPVAVYASGVTSINEPTDTR